MENNIKIRPVEVSKLRKDLEGMPLITFNNTLAGFFIMPIQGYNKYLRSDKWRQIRIRILQRDRYKCTICSSKRKLNIHHLSYKNFTNEKDNELTTLCERCHARIHGNNVKYYDTSKYKTYIERYCIKIIPYKNDYCVKFNNNIYWNIPKKFCRIDGKTNKNGEFQIFINKGWYYKLKECMRTI